MPLLAIGTRIYNAGDMANIDHFGTITGIRVNTWATEYEITPDPDAGRPPYTYPAFMLSTEYGGNHSTRVVTEAAYNAWRANRGRSRP